MPRLFSFPLQITSGGGEPSSTTVPNQSAWLSTIDRLLDAYRRIGLRRAELLELRTIEIDPRLALAVVRWRLLDSRGQLIYEFDAVYTIVDLGNGLRITAIAHTEPPLPMIALTS